MFKITITEIRRVTCQGGKQWTKVSEKEGDAQYGYTPEIDVEKDIEIERLKQTVDVIDMQAVICALNGLHKPESKNAAGAA